VLAVHFSKIHALQHFVIDLSKAFDKVNHHALLIKLMKRNLPVVLIERRCPRHWQRRNQHRYDRGTGQRVAASGATSTHKLIVMPPPVGNGALSVGFVRRSVAYIANNWRIRRPSVPKFGMKVPYL